MKNGLKNDFSWYRFTDCALVYYVGLSGTKVFVTFDKIFGLEARSIMRKKNMK
jgi:hypothetical protein